MVEIDDEGAWLDKVTWESIKDEARQVTENAALKRSDILAIGVEPTYLCFCANGQPGISVYLPIAQTYIYIEAGNYQRRQIERGKQV